MTPPLWQKVKRNQKAYWSFSFSIIPSKEILGLTSFRMDWLDLLAVRDSQEPSPTPQFKSINSLALRQHIKKQRHYFANKGPSSQNYGFSSSHVWM